MQEFGDGKAHLPGQPDFFQPRYQHEPNHLLPWNLSCVLVATGNLDALAWRGTGTSKRSGHKWRASGAASDVYLFCSPGRASVFAFSDSSGNFCENSLLAVMTGNFKDALSLLQADVCVANYKVMHNIYDGEIYCWHATRFWFAPGTSSCITSAFYLNRMILFFIPRDSKSKNVVNVLDKIY